MVGKSLDRSPIAPEEMLMHTNEPNATMLLGPRAHGILAHAHVEMPLTTEE